MPLIDITLRPGYEMKLANMVDDVSAAVDITQHLVRCHFARALPDIFVENAGLLKIDSDTPPEGIQVQNHDYGEFDVNVANIWVRVQLSENPPNEATRAHISSMLYKLLKDWFVNQGFVPENFVIDLFWGPTSGRGTVDGVEIAW